MKINVVIFLLFGFLATSASFSQTRQIDALKKKRLTLQEEINTTNKLFLDTKKQTNTFLQRINLINKQIDMRKEMVGIRQNEITALDNQLSELDKEIGNLNIALKQKQDSYAKAIQGMIKSRQTENKLFFILSGKSFGESIRRMQYLKEYSGWQKTQAQEIKQQNKLLSEKKIALDSAKTDKQKALSSLQYEQSKLMDEEKTKKVEMTAVQGKQKELQKILKDKQNQAGQLNKQIENLIAEEVARQERERIAREKEEAERRRKAEAAAEKARKEKEAKELAAREKETKEKARLEKKTKKQKKDKKEETAQPVVTQPKPEPETPKDTYVASAETFNLSKNFIANKGKLPMPVTGSATIISNFGVNKHSEWNVSTNSNGIDIQGQRNANIRTVFDGEVSKVFSFPGSNTCIIVRHGDYYTFYGNIIELYVKMGDKVKTGQALGKIYTDSDTGISTMHFQLWQKTTKLNPTPWLKR